MVISHSFRTSAVLGIGFGTSLGHQLPIRLEELVSVRSSRRRFWKSLASEKGERCSLPLGFRAPEKLRPSQGHCNDNVSIWTQRPKRAIYFEVFDSSNVELKHQTQRSCWSSTTSLANAITKKRKTLWHTHHNGKPDAILIHEPTIHQPFYPHESSYEPSQEKIQQQIQSSKTENKTAVNICNLYLSVASFSWGYPLVI